MTMWRFGIRDWFWLLLTAWAAAAWLVDHSYQVRVLSAVSELRSRGGSVFFGEKAPGYFGNWLPSANRIEPTIVAFGSRDFSSRHGSASVVGRPSRTIHDDVMPIICRLPSIRELDLGNTRVSDSGVQHLVAMKSLTSLWLNGTPITDGSVQSLEKMTHLTNLDISNTRITYDGYRKLQGTLKQTYVDYD